MNGAGIAAYAAALAIDAIIPGPNLLAIVAVAARAGRKKAGWMIAGMAIGDLIYLSFAIGGLTYIAQTHATLFKAIKWAGFAYLLFLALQFWRSDANPRIWSASGQSAGRVVMISGFALTICNPRTMLFYAAILPGLINPTALSWVEISALLAVTAMVITMVQYPFAALGESASQYLQSARTAKMLNRGAALCIIAAAVMIAGQN